MMESLGSLYWEKYSCRKLAIDLFNNDLGSASGVMLHNALNIY
jgi:hypothetical protein